MSSPPPSSASPAAVTPTATVTRRRAVAALAGGLGGTLLAGGCGVRLEEGAPRIPFVPTREPVPAERVLIDLESASRTLAEQASSLGGDLGPVLAPLHVAQADLVRETLLHGGLPSKDLKPPASPSAPGSAAELARAEVADVSPPHRLAPASPQVRPSLLALAAQRYAAATLLTGSEPDVGPDPDAGATRLPLPSSAGSLYVELLRARYLFQVVAARSADSQRDRAVEASTVLALWAERTRAMLTTVPEPPLGYPLPMAVPDGAAAAQLATQVCVDLLAAHGRVLPEATTGSAPAVETSFDRFTRWIGQAVVLAHDWGVALSAFPGLE